MTDDWVGADGRAADGVDGAAVAAGEVVDHLEEEAGDEVEPLGVEGDALAVEEYLGALPGGEDELSFQDAFSLERASIGASRAIILVLRGPCHRRLDRRMTARCTWTTTRRTNPVPGVKWSP